MANGKTLRNVFKWRRFSEYSSRRLKEFMRISRLRKSERKIFDERFSRLFETTVWQLKPEE